MWRQSYVSLDEMGGVINGWNWCKITSLRGTGGSEYTKNTEEQQVSKNHLGLIISATATDLSLCCCLWLNMCVTVNWLGDYLLGWQEYIDNMLSKLEIPEL